MHRLPFADNGNINAGWSAIPHCSRIAMHLKASLSRATRLKKGEEDESTPCRSRAARCKNEFAQVCILLFFFFLRYLEQFYSFERDTISKIRG